MTHPLHLCFPTGSNYGWGLCGHHLTQELPKILPTEILENDALLPPKTNLPGVLFGALEGANLKPWFSSRAEKNIGYVFFENELPGETAIHARELELILAGSTWCRDRIKEKGIAHTDVLLQGIDPELFHPLPPRKEDGTFVIYSAGKFELRKGQDLVLKAFSLLSPKYPAMRLINVWENQWPQSTATMSASTHIHFKMDGESWKEKVATLCIANGIPSDKVMTCPLVPQSRLPSMIARADIGLFPNRCEGGTNLALMEFMACGKTAIASYTSGHCDLLTGENSIPLRDLKPFTVLGTEGQIAARWEEPSIDELVNALESAYLQRESLKAFGEQAARDLARLTWRDMAQKAFRYLQPYLKGGHDARK